MDEGRSLLFWGLKRTSSRMKKKHDVSVSFKGDLRVPWSFVFEDPDMTSTSGRIWGNVRQIQLSSWKVMIHPARKSQLNS